MHRSRLDEDLGGPAPDRDEPITAPVALEAADVGADPLDHLELVRSALRVCAVETPHVPGVEDPSHRLDRPELVLHLLDVLTLEHFGVVGRLEGVIRKDVPAAEFELVEVRERNEIGNRGRLLVGALA